MKALTLAIFVAPWLVWLALELVILLRRRAGTGDPTISTVARGHGRRLSSVVYLWGGMAAHWWWTAPAPATVAGSVIFWLLAAGLLAQDAILWRTPVEEWPAWIRWSRWPPRMLILGVAAGRFLFPQVER